MPRASSLNADASDLQSLATDRVGIPAIAERNAQSGKASARPRDLIRTGENATGREWVATPLARLLKTTRALPRLCRDEFRAEDASAPIRIEQRRVTPMAKPLKP